MHKPIYIGPFGLTAEYRIDDLLFYLLAVIGFSEVNQVGSEFRHSLVGAKGIEQRHFVFEINEMQKAVGDLTGVPVVLNTSFNDNEPIVCRPEEALDCFRRTQLDVLVMGNFALEKKSALAASAMSADGFAEPSK